MSLLTKPSELKQETLLKGLIYGQPGIGKTTLALSAPNAVLLDFDKGLHRVQPQHRVPSLQVENYQQVLDLLASEEINGFNTIVCDTLGKLIDRICDYVASKNPKARQGDGQMAMKGWGEVKIAFQNLLKLLQSKGKSIIFVAHESEEKDGDDTKKRPDCAGSARKDIVKELDFMGYMEMVGNKCTINFAPTEKFYAKNSLGLTHALDVKYDASKPNDFISREIMKLSKDRLVQQADLRSKYEGIVDLITANIEALENEEDVNNYYAEMSKLQHIWDSKFIERHKLAEHIKTIGIEFDVKTKTFKKTEVKDATDNTIVA
jgi:hypothetical protein